MNLVSEGLLDYKERIDPRPGILFLDGERMDFLTRIFKVKDSSRKAFEL